MAIIPRNDAHPSLSPLPTGRPYEFLDLADRAGTYATTAIADHPGCLELHITVLRWGPRSARAMRRDLEWLKDLARSRGKGRIVGITIPQALVADQRWFKFARAYGFTSQCLAQSAELILDGDPVQRRS